ncbi:MAG: LytTR family transcriptional regulator DNA-binding domain-containing protein [Bacteroidales bacterium]|nr:LytTR family transcriptional regulator DNA-binding domain-containing protein [Bacteroidales bacterium]
MKSVLSYLPLNERGVIEPALRDIAARKTDGEWETHGFSDAESVHEYLANEPALDVLNWDLTVGDGLEELKGVRPRYKQAFLMVLADASISPMAYIRPNIVPNSLLLKPYTELELHTVLNEIVESCDETEGSANAEAVLIETREGTRRVPYAKIYYIEAREKKIYIRTRTEEFGFYHSIDSMLDELPPYFQRCHRSYIANMKKALQVNNSDNSIEMGNGIRVPIARSYKKQIKESEFL